MSENHSADFAECPASSLRRTLYALLITVAAGSMLGRILAVDSVDHQAIRQYRLKQIPGELARRRAQLEQQGLDAQRIDAELVRVQNALVAQAEVCRPFLSANDRSRWCTVRALVEPQMRVPGAPYAIDRVIEEPLWDTIDMVKHDGHLYSSKPPLLATLAAGPYWVIHRLTGATLGTHPYTIGRALLVLYNVVPLCLYFVLLARAAERYGQSDWGRLFVVAAAGFGTLLTSFAVVLNNHLPAAFCTMLAVYSTMRIVVDGRRQLRYFVVAGFGAALAASNELPALSLLAGVFILLLLREPFASGAEWIRSAFRRLPPAHRLLLAPRQLLLGFVPAVAVVAAAFFGTNWVAHRSLRPPYMHRSETNPADNWYRFTYERGGRTVQSYWTDPVGIDRGEPSPAVYAFHVLVGHHGVFSLTPIWLLSVAGFVLWSLQRHNRQLREAALMLAAMSAVCLVFYLTRPLGDRNYGGMTCGFRWAFWLAPVWLVAMVPAADVFARQRWLRGLALALLAVSVLSACYPTWSPWTHPWIANWMLYLGWLEW